MISRKTADLKHSKVLPAIQNPSFCVQNIFPWVAVEWLFQSLLVKGMPEKDQLMKNELVLIVYTQK